MDETLVEGQILYLWDTCGILILQSMNHVATGMSYIHLYCKHYIDISRWESTEPHFERWGLQWKRTQKGGRAWRAIRVGNTLKCSLWELGEQGAWARTAALAAAMLSSILCFDSGWCIYFLPNSAAWNAQIEFLPVECLFFSFLVTAHRYIVITLRWFEAKSWFEKLYQWFTLESTQ